MTSKYKKYGKGWFRESERHRLARLGVGTVSPKPYMKTMRGIGLFTAATGGVIALTSAIAVGLPLITLGGTIYAVGWGGQLLTLSLKGKKDRKLYEKLKKEGKLK